MKTIRITNSGFGFFDIRDANTNEVIHGVTSFRIDAPTPGEAATVTLTILDPDIDITADEIELNTGGQS